MAKGPKAGDLIAGQFVLRHEIGRGSMGVVFEAHQLGLERRVAVKTLLPSAMTNSVVVDRFTREARMASSLNHPNLVTIHAFGVEPLPFIVMEFLEGEDLRDHLGRVGSMSLEDTVAVMGPALMGIGVAHRQGVVHRDLKPENIFLAETVGANRTIKVLDFGIAKAVTSQWGSMVERLTGTGMACGTPHYMAPEQLRGADDIGPPADVYSLGCVLFELLMGYPPFDGKSAVDIAVKHIEQSPPALAEMYAGTHVEYVIFRALAKNAAGRFEDATEMLGELNKAIEYRERPQDASSSGGSWAVDTIRVDEAARDSLLAEDDEEEWSKETIRVEDGVERFREYRAGLEAKAAGYYAEPETDPGRAAQIAATSGVFVELPRDGSKRVSALGYSDEDLTDPVGSEPITDPVMDSSDMVNHNAPQDRTIPVPRLAALPKGESMEDFKRRAGAGIVSAPRELSESQNSAPGRTRRMPKARRDKRRRDTMILVALVAVAVVLVLAVIAVMVIAAMGAR